MAKFDNNLDIKKVIEFAEKNKDKLLQNIPNDVETALNHFNENKTTKVYIFSKSIAYRQGKSSVKSISGYNDGFKGSFNNSNEEIFNISLSLGNSKFSKICRFALIVCLKDPSRILTQEDKTEAAESEEVLRTQTQLINLMDRLGSNFITIVMGSNEYKINGFRQISGRPKADMAFTYDGKDVIWVSHKLGKKPADFQQYGGFPKDLGMENNKRYSPILDSNGNKEILDFLESIDKILFSFYNMIPVNGMFDLSKLPKGTNFSVPVTTRKIAEVTMFGKDYGKQFGLDNVHVLIDGNILFNKLADGVYELNGSYHRTYNPKLNGVKDELSNLSNLGVYQPMIMITRSESQGLKQAGFLNARASIWPRNRISETYFAKFKKELNEANKKK